MDKISINGGKPLSGEIVISGMKNAAVAILLANIMVEDECTIENLPNISDVNRSLDILEAMGAKITRLSPTSVKIDSTNVIACSAPDELVKKMRASYYVLGAELARFGRSSVACPGGCDFGVRPIDQHIKGFEALGANVSVTDNHIIALTTEGVKGGSVFMDVVSVGATINIMLAAAKAEGVTVIENAAREPHIVDTANFLNACGAKISGAGTDVIKITGVPKLHGVTYAIIPDMIEAGTFMVLASATCGKIKISNVIPKHLESISAKLEEMGSTIVEEDDAVTVSRSTPLSPINVKTQPYPGFPTDMNPQMCVLMCLANGKSKMIEGVWNNRFRYVEELKRMGAEIEVNDTTATINGSGSKMQGASVRAIDLRAGAAMVIAGLAVKGHTDIEDIFHIQRGYEDIIGKLKAVGADIEIISTP